MAHATILEFGLLNSPSPCGRGLGGGGSHFQATLSDDFEHSFNVFKDFIIPESQHNKTVRTKTDISLHIVPRIFRMLSAVKFNDNPCVEGDEVNYVCFNCLLPAKLDAFKLTVSQMPP